WRSTGQLLHLCYPRAQECRLRPGEPDIVDDHGACGGDVEDEPHFAERSRVYATKIRERNHVGLQHELAVGPETVLPVAAPVDADRQRAAYGAVCGERDARGCAGRIRHLDREVDGWQRVVVAALPWRSPLRGPVRTGGIRGGR